MAQLCQGEKPPESRVGLSFGAFRTRLVFVDRGTVDLEEVAIGGSFERKLNKQVTFQVSCGGIIYGRLGGPTAQPLHGMFVGAGVSWSVLNQKGAIPFVMTGLSVSASLAVPERGGDDGFYALDFRGWVTAGYTFAKRFTAYGVGRLFGGPIALVEGGSTTARGTDQYHFQLGAGLVVGLPGGFDLSAELVPLGERRVSAGIGASF